MTAARLFCPGHCFRDAGPHPDGFCDECWSDDTPGAQAAAQRRVGILGPVPPYRDPTCRLPHECVRRDGRPLVPGESCWHAARAEVLA